MNPGHVTIHCKYNNGTVLGASTNATMTFTFSNASGQHSSIVLGQGVNDKTFSADIKTRHKMLLAVVPPQGGLVRLGGEYSVEVTGDVAFGAQKSGDPIVGTYTQMAGMTSNYGACKFKADGSIMASTGATGTWKLFDADSHTYVIVLDGQRLSLVFRPGRGLTDPSDPSAVDFQAVR